MNPRYRGAVRSLGKSTRSNNSRKNTQTKNEELCKVEKRRNNGVLARLGEGIFLLLVSAVVAYSLDLQQVKRSEEFQEILSQQEATFQARENLRSEVAQNTAFVREVSIRAEEEGINKPFRALNLIEADLGGLYLNCQRDDEGRCEDRTRADFDSADLARAQLYRTRLVGADLTGAILSGADLTGVRLQMAIAPRAYFTDATMVGADLEGANLKSSHLEGTNLRDANLDSVDLSQAKMRDADLSGASLDGAILRCLGHPVCDGYYASLGVR